MASNKIIIKGAKEHNLKNIDLENTARQACGIYGSFGFRKVLACI